MPRFRELKAEGPVQLKLKGEKGGQTKTRYFSHSHILTFENSQLVRERDEVVEFSILNKYTDVNPSNGDISFVSTAVDKDGSVALNDLAFPEVKEKMEYILTTTGEVLKAGEQPVNSVFYLPPVPLPKSEVEVGDTWELTREWIGKNNGIPLQVKVVAILKSLVDCEGKTCAVIEVSGNVGVLADEVLASRFASELQGYVLFSIDKGDVLWSRIQSTETLQLPDDSSKVVSCMSSVLIEPEDVKPEIPAKDHKCELPKNI